MFRGEYLAFVDGKWWLYLPLLFRLEFGVDPDSDRVFFMEGDGRIKIYPFYDNHAGQSRISGSRKRIFVRMKIPEAFRNSESFSSGNEVTVVGAGDHLEVLPRSPAEQEGL